MNNQNFNNSNPNLNWNNQNNLNPNNQNNGFNNNYANNNNTQSNSKNKKIVPFIIIALVVLVGIFGITKLFGSSSSGKGYTVSIGEELKIEQLDGIFDFSIEVLSQVEQKHIVKEGILGDDKYDAYAIKVNVKNNGDSELYLNDWRLAYQLVDSTDNEVQMLNAYDAFDFDGAIQTTIASGSSATGYLYFFDSLADENTPAIDINKVSKLEIGVLKTSNDDGVITGNYESYFVKLK
jgi:flagellar basal body-associated protein FliL